MKTPCAAALLLACTLFTHSLQGQEWSRFRGPNGEGTSDAAGIPTSWTPDDYRWRVKLPGLGHSSPVVHGDQVFVTSASEDDATQFIHCLRTVDGRLVWKRDFPSAPHEKHEFNCYASSTPTVDEDGVYFAWATPERLSLVKLSRTDGSELWRRDLGPFVAEHAFGASPMLYQDMVILPNEQDGHSSVIALSRATGETRWLSARRTEKAAYATPCIYRPEDGPPQLLVTSWAHGPSALDPTSGKPLWEHPVFNYRVVASPVVAGGLIFGSCGSGGIGRQMIAVRPGNPSTGTPPETAYEIKGSLPYVCTPVAYGDLLFSWFDAGVVTCLDAPTGRVHWRERIGGDYFGSPIRVRDRIYCVSREGQVVVLAASTEFEELARMELGEASYGTPAVAHGVMYLRTLSSLMAVGGE